MVTSAMTGVIQGGVEQSCDRDLFRHSPLRDLFTHSSLRDRGPSTALRSATENVTP